MAAVDGSGVFYGVETTPGVFSGTEPLINFPFQSVDLSANFDFSPSGEARPDFYDTEEDIVAQNTGLNITRKFRPYLYDDFLESAVFGRFTKLTRRNNFYGSGAQQISAVAAGSQTITVTDEGAANAYAENDLVRAIGFSNVENAGPQCMGRILVATAGTNATSLVAAGAGLVDEATPPPGAALERVGIKFIAGDLSIVGQTLVSAAGVDLQTKGVRQGTWLKIGGDNILNRFGADADVIAPQNDAVRVGDIANAPAGTIPLDRVPDNWADDAGAAKEIYVFISEVLLPANMVKTMYWLSKIRQGAGNFDLRGHEGLYASRLRMTGQARGDYVMNVEMTGLKFVPNAVDTSAANGGPINPLLYPAMVAGLSGQRIYADGIYSTKNLTVRSSTLEISPTLVPIDVEGCFGYDSMDRSTQIFTFDGESHFQNSDLYNRYATATMLDFARIMQSGSGAYVFEAPRQQIREGNVNVPGIGQNTTLNFGSKATADDAGIKAGNLVEFFGIHRFRWAEGWLNLC